MVMLPAAGVAAALEDEHRRTLAAGRARDELAAMMYGGVDTDYPALQATGQQVRNVLAAGKQLV